MVLKHPALKLDELGTLVDEDDADGFVASLLFAIPALLLGFGFLEAVAAGSACFLFETFLVSTLGLLAFRRKSVSFSSEASSPLV